MCIYRSYLILFFQAIQTLNTLCKCILIILHTNLCLDHRLLPQRCDPKELVLLLCQLCNFIARHIFQRNLTSCDLFAVSVRFLKSQSVICNLLRHIFFYLFNTLQCKIITINRCVEHKMTVKVKCHANIGNCQNCQDHTKRDTDFLANAASLWFLIFIFVQRYKVCLEIFIVIIIYVKLISAFFYCFFILVFLLFSKHVRQTPLF